MKNLLLVCLLMFAAISKTAFAEIREAPTMADALSDAGQGTLVILDLDNTTMMPPQSLGGEEWYDYFVEKRTKESIKKGLNEVEAKEKAIDQGLKEWNQFHKNAVVVPVESDTANVIAETQKKGAITMALTARPVDLAQSTVTQLASIGIDLGKQTVSPKEINVKGKNNSLFYKGLLLVGPKNNKGEVLVKFLEVTKFKPKKVIFVDNKQHHVENVQKAIAPTQIPYFGRRHGAADKKIASMNKDVVEIQHKYFFGGVLSNIEATKLLDRK